jgi:hypothetical protein
MAHSSIVQLLEPEQVRSLLSINEADLQWLVDTNQLPAIRIHGKSRFDAADLVCFVNTYKNIQQGRY